MLRFANSFDREASSRPTTSQHHASKWRRRFHTAREASVLARCRISIPPSSPVGLRRCARALGTRAITKYYYKSIGIYNASQIVSPAHAWTGLVQERTIMYSACAGLCKPVQACTILHKACTGLYRPVHRTAGDHTDRSEREAKNAR